ncbi:Chlorovirus glycoprotein repeat domain-containing protein [Paramecium bursaria Chlorella virus NE-JV-1]|nr:Chlorovirus glycoprotein repeat domain-containing protein [Paramecium bursaria Chlorella virus NE-JV-1]
MPTLPPTFLRSTLYTNQVIGNVIVNGGFSTTGNAEATFFIGNGSMLTGLAQATLPSMGNIDIVGNVVGTDVTVSNAITAATFIGDGSQLSNVIPEDISVTSVTATTFSGDGSALTGVLHSIPDDLSVVTVYATNTVTSYDIIASNAVYAPNAFVAGDVTADYFIGNGALLTGITTTVEGNLTVDSVVASGNVTAEYLLGNGALLTGVLTAVDGNLTVDSVVASGNVTAEYLLGNGSLLTGVLTTVDGNLTVDSVVASGNVTAEYLLGNGSLLTGVLTAVDGNLTVDSVVASGNVTADFFIGNGALLTGIVTDVTGNLTVESVVATGNVEAAFFIGNGSLLTDVIPADLIVDTIGAQSIGTGELNTDYLNSTNSVTTYAVIANSITTSNIFARGNVEASYFIGNGALLTGIVTDVSGNLTVDSLIATGNVEADHFIGNGSELTGVLHTIPADLDVVDVFASNAIATADIFVSNAVSAVSFVGDGSLLTGVVHEIPTDLTLTSLTATSYMTTPDLTVDNGIITFDIKASNSSYATESFAANITATDYFFGNGVYLSDVLHEIPLTLNVNTVNALVTVDTANLNAQRAQVERSLIVGNAVTANVFLGDGSQLAGIVALNGDGKIAQTDLDGFLVVPQGYTANMATRLALAGGALPVGSLVRQVDSNLSYMLSATPSNVDVNWFQFDGLNFPVNTVFGRNGDVQSSFGDYLDDYIETSANVGPVLTGNSVAAALQYLVGQVESIKTFINFP